MKRFAIILFFTCALQTHALVINEIMSNPIGDDSGREWFEIYNDSSDSVDISSLTVSVKGGNPIVVTPISGGTFINGYGYAVVGSTVSGTTKFIQDYPNYNGPLFKSSISLVNTGVTSIQISLNGSVVDTISSYTGAKEGMTYSRIANSFVEGNPTPGGENQASDSGSQSKEEKTTNDTTTLNQTVLPQMSPPSADIVLYISPEKTVVAGADSIFSAFALTHNGDTISNLNYSWAFGDGGQAVGSSTTYRYVYPGNYIAQVEATNGYILGTARVNVRVVSPEINIVNAGNSKYGPYIDVHNPNQYDLDLSQWKISVNGVKFDFPKNTMIARNNITHFSGTAMGFSSTTLSSSTEIKILFPNLETVTQYQLIHEHNEGNRNEVKEVVRTQPLKAVSNDKSSALTKSSSVRTSNQPISTSTTKIEKHTTKDTRLVTFFKTLFRR